MLILNLRVEFPKLDLLAVWTDLLLTHALDLHLLHQRLSFLIRLLQLCLTDLDFPVDSCNFTVLLIKDILKLFF